MSGCSRAKKSACSPPRCKWVTGKGCRRGTGISINEAVMALQLVQAQLPQVQPSATCDVAALQAQLAEKDALIAQLRAELAQCLASTGAAVAEAAVPVPTRKTADSTRALNIKELSYPWKYFTGKEQQAVLLASAQSNELSVDSAVAYLRWIQDKFAGMYERYLKHMDLKVENTPTRQAREKAKSAYDKIKGIHTRDEVLSQAKRVQNFVVQAEKWVRWTLHIASTSPSEAAELHAVSPEPVFFSDFIVICSWYALLLQMVPLLLEAKQVQTGKGDLGIALNELVRNLTIAYFTRTLAEFVDGERRQLYTRFSAFLASDYFKPEPKRLQKLQSAHNQFIASVDQVKSASV